MRKLPIVLQIRNFKRWMNKNGYDAGDLQDSGIFDSLDSTLCYSENFQIIKEEIKRMNIQRPFKIEMEEYIEKQKLSEEDEEQIKDNSETEEEVYPQILP